MGYISAKYSLPFNITQTIILIKQLASAATNLTV
jgi:hypothetical protein